MVATTAANSRIPEAEMTRLARERQAWSEYRRALWDLTLPDVIEVSQAPHKIGSHVFIALLLFLIVTKESGISFGVN